MLSPGSLVVAAASSACAYLKPKRAPILSVLVKHSAPATFGGRTTADRHASGERGFARFVMRSAEVRDGRSGQSAGPETGEPGEPTGNSRQPLDALPLRI